jgi:anti-anti-sigma regulatory factor
MATNAVRLKIDGDRVAQALEETTGKLNEFPGEIVLDFSSVRRIDPDALRALENLANVANGKSSAMALSGVSVDVYKVLTLTELTSRFSFLS